jgi:two-component system response regulator YesN
MESNHHLKLCVIDDIKSVVEMISRKIAWQEYGIEVAGTALDGDEGLRMAGEVQPDIILTDIRMPKMDGLEMTQAILQLNPKCKIIILSAYSDFSYAQQALRLGAFDFVKKPFSIDEIVSVALKAKSACEEDRLEAHKLQEMELQIKASLPILQQEYVTLLLHHSTNAASALKRWEYLDIHLEPSHFVVFIVEIDQFMDKYHALPAQEIELIRFSLQNIMEETIAGSTKGMIFRESILRYVVVMNSSNSQTSADIAEACRLNIEQYTRFTVSIGVGLEVAGIQDLPASYQQALTSLSYHFYTEGNGVFSYTNIPRKSRGVPNYSFSKEQEFLFALRSGNSEKSKLLLEEIFNELVALEPLPEPKYVENVCYELASKIFRVILEKFPYESVQQLEGQIHDIQNKDQPSLQELKSLLSNLCSEGCGWIEKERSHESTRIIHQAKAYISANLHMDLSLEHCAKQVNLSQGYFSNLFKKVLGISFQQFVIQEKMEKAKSMLIGDYQVQEIAQELGYEHRRYFSDIFKKYTGMTPSEFKMSYIGKP